MNIDLEFLLIQLLGFIPSIIAFTALQSGSRKRILTLQILCCILWIVHYALLGAASAVVTNIVGLGRAIVCSFNDRKWASHKASTPADGAWLPSPPVTNRPEKSLTF